MTPPAAERLLTITADLVANVIAVHVQIDDAVRDGQVLLVMESMKMEIPVIATAAGVITQVGVAVGDIVQEGDLLVAMRR